MTERSSFPRGFEKKSDLPVFGFMLSLVLFVIGYYISGQDPQEGIQGYEAIFISTDMLVGKYLFIGAGLFFLVSFIGYVRESDSRKRASFIDEGRSLAALEALSWKEFVDYIIDLFRRLGYTLESASGVGAEGADLKFLRDGRLSVVRCKKYYVRKVSLSMVVEFCDSISTNPELEKGYFITTGFFSHEARKHAAGRPIELIDGVRLVDFARIADSVEVAREVSPMQGELRNSDFVCPKCGASMVLRTMNADRTQGTQFWGCSSYPACKGALRKEHEEIGRPG